MRPQKHIDKLRFAPYLRGHERGTGGERGRRGARGLSPKTGVERAVQRGVALAAGKFGWALEIIDPALTGDDVRPFAELLGRADGVIVRLAERCGLVRPFLGPDVPMVGIDIAASRDSGLWATLLPDNAAIGAVAAEELLAMGLACHAIVPSLPALTWGVARDRGFAARVRASGGDVRVYEPHEGWRAAAEHGALARWLAVLPRPFGLFGCNDVVARFALSACKSAGLAVPDEARVVGADNDETLCLFCSPPLTSVRIDHEGAGRRAAEVLQGCFGRRQPDRVAVMRFGPCGVERRASTGFAPQDGDPRLDAGLSFLSRHYANRLVGAADVAAAMGLGRRQAERLFRAAGKSIRTEIESARLAHVMTLLSTTGLPLRRIAAESGFSTEIYLSGLFRKRFGVSPGAWRRAHRDAPD